MKQKEYTDLFTTLLESAEAMKEPDPQAVKTAAQQLKMLHFDFNLGDVGPDPETADPAWVTQKMQEIHRLSPEEIDNSLIAEKTWTPESGISREDWVRKTKIHRMRVLLNAYILLQRLRNDEPEAWDEINELYFDD